MGRAYSIDLRERVVAAVERDGLSRHQAAARFGVGISTAILWVQRFRRTGSVAPDKIGGYKPRKIAGTHRDWLVQLLDAVADNAALLAAGQDEKFQSNVAVVMKPPRPNGVKPE